MIEREVTVAGVAGEREVEQDQPAEAGRDNQAGVPMRELIDTTARPGAGAQRASAARSVKRHGRRGQAEHEGGREVAHALSARGEDDVAGRQRNGQGTRDSHAAPAQAASAAAMPSAGAGERPLQTRKA